MAIRLFAFAIIFFTFSCLSDKAYASETFVVFETNFEGLGGTNFYSNGVNGLGQVIGGYNSAEGLPRAFLWQDGTIQDLGTLGEIGVSNAFAINNSGQVVGISIAADGLQHYFLWQNGIMQDLGTFGGVYLYSIKLNDSGQIFGVYSAADGSQHVALWQNGTLQDLGTLGGVNSSAIGTNGLGQVALTSEAVDGSMHAFLWQNGTLQDLGTLGGVDSFATAINDLGQIVGRSTTQDGSSHAFLWQNGIMQDLGTLGGVDSYPTGINDSGQVVGMSTTLDGTENAFLWQNGTMQNLNELFYNNTGHQSSIYPNKIGNNNFFISTNALFQIVTTGRPTALAGNNRNVLRQIILDGSQSNDPDGQVAFFKWELRCRGNSDFDRTVLGKTVTITDLDPGYYDVYLTIKDNHGVLAWDSFIAHSEIGITGDLNGDGLVDGQDLAVFSTEYGK